MWRIVSAGALTGAVWYSRALHPANAKEQDASEPSLNGSPLRLRLVQVVTSTLKEESSDVERCGREVRAGKSCLPLSPTLPPALTLVLCIVIAVSRGCTVSRKSACASTR